MTSGSIMAAGSAAPKESATPSTVVPPRLRWTRAAGRERVFAGMSRLVDAGVTLALDAVEQMELGKVVATFDLERRRVNRRGQRGFALFDKRGNLAIELCQVKATAEDEQQEHAGGRAPRTKPLKRAAQSSNRR